MLPGALSKLSREHDTSEKFTDMSEVISTAESLRTNSHGGPVNKSKTILELYHKVSDKESEDQEILLNLIEKSKDRNNVDKDSKLYMYNQGWIEASVVRGGALHNLTDLRRDFNVYDRFAS